MIVELIIGDWSDDSHGKTSSVFIETDFEGNLYSLFRQMLESFPEARELCRDYEDRSMNHKFTDIIDSRTEGKFYTFLNSLPHGDTDSFWMDVADSITGEYPKSLKEIPDPLFIKGLEKGWSVSLNYEFFAKIILFLMQNIEPTFTYKITRLSSLAIGGYGLFD